LIGGSYVHTQINKRKIFICFQINNVSSGINIARTNVTIELLVVVVVAAAAAGLPG